jgi:hypothetical protein
MEHAARASNVRDAVLVRTVRSQIPIDVPHDQVPAFKHPQSALIVGGDLAALRVLNSFWPSVMRPVIWVHGRKLALPAAQCGTLVVERGDLLDDWSQHSLLAWMDGTGTRTSVLTISPVPLFPLVQNGDLLDVLYYRLNQWVIFADDRRS